MLLVVGFSYTFSPMRICVCGLGKVGKPLLRVLRLKGFHAVGYDSNAELSEASLAGAVANSDAVIFIVPTPSLPDGSFSNDHLLDAIDKFSEEVLRQGKLDYLYIVGSTTVPGSCDAFRQVVGDNLCYKPEFIRSIYGEETVVSDLENPAFILIGSESSAAADQCESIYRHISQAPVKRMSLVEAELAKITLNCALTMKISLANQLHLVAEKLGADSAKIMDAVGTDPRIGRSYLNPGWPYGGPCLPRDNRMFRYVAARAGVYPHLSDAADLINAMIQGPAKESWVEPQEVAVRTR